MRIARDQRQIVLNSDGGDPYIVFGNGFADEPQLIFDEAVVSGGFDIAMKNGLTCGQIIDTSNIGINAPRFTRAKIEFSQNNT